jgi:hypothetical protein
LDIRRPFLCAGRQFDYAYRTPGFLTCLVQPRACCSYVVAADRLSERRKKCVLEELSHVIPFRVVDWCIPLPCTASLAHPVGLVCLRHGRKKVALKPREASTICIITQINNTPFLKTQTRFVNGVTTGREWGAANGQGVRSS